MTSDKLAAEIPIGAPTPSPGHSGGDVMTALDARGNRASRLFVPAQRPLPFGAQRRKVYGATSSCVRLDEDVSAASEESEAHAPHGSAAGGSADVRRRSA